MDLVTLLLGALAGPLLILGLTAVVVATRPPPTRPTGRTPVSRRIREAVPANWSDRALLRATLATAALVVVGATTGWPVAALLGAGAAAMAPSLIGAKARRRASVERIEAIASWTEQLRDLMAAAEGIQAAVVATGPVAPPAIRLEVGRLVDRISTRRERLRPSLLAFADELAHPLGDMVVTSLLLAAEHRGSPTEMLAEVASSARRSAALRLEIEATRTQTYVTTRLILILTAVTGAWLVIGQRQYMAPYSTPAGQLMLLVIGAVFALSGLKLHRMAQPVESPRLLTPTGDREAT